jgi:hypothetical protein
MKRLALIAMTLLLTAAAPASWRGTAAGQPVAITGSDLRVGTAGSLVQAHWQGFDPPQKDEEHEASFQLLSVVGPLVSVETHFSGMSPGAAHPYANAAIRAYDLRRGRKVANLLDWFAPPDVYQALMKDTLVQTALKGHPKPADLTQLLKETAGYQSEDCSWGFDGDLLTAFAFHHVRGKQVAVRFGLTHGCEVARGGLTILAIYLPIPKALAADLAAASTGKRGFLVPGAPRITATSSR